MNCDAFTFDTRMAGALELLWGSLPALIGAFIVTVLAVPVARRVAHATGVVDKPDQVRKLHGRTVAYLGGVGVFVGIFAGILAGAVFANDRLADLAPVRPSIVLGMVVITFTGLADDIWKFDARLKIAGQLVAAAALALDDIGVNVAVGALAPIMGSPGDHFIHFGAFQVQNATVFYWTGTAAVAAFVLGGCNAANLIDGLDGLLSGVTAIMCVGLLAISLAIVFALPPHPELADPSVTSMAGVRVVLCMAALGACLGFLIYNFNPASIFLGDAGSLLLGFVAVAIIMSFANIGPFDCPYVNRAGTEPSATGVMPGPTAGYDGYPLLLVMCGLTLFGLPILDTLLAMIRRKRSGVSFSTADAHHLHHRFKRSFGGSVRKAVLALYGVQVLLVVVGVAVALYLLIEGGQLRVPFLVLVAVFVVALLLAMRGMGTAPQQRPADAPAGP